MTKIVVLGGTGFTGGNIVREAAARGYEVTSYSRNVPVDKIPGVSYETGSLLEDNILQRAVHQADVVIAALAPRGELDGKIQDLYARVGEVAAARSARFGVIGGFSALRITEGGPRMAEGDDIPAEFAAEAGAMFDVLVHLETSAPEGLDWFYASPAAGYGSYIPGVATGKYRMGTDVAILDTEGTSAISGADFALAIINEITTPTHHKSQFSVAY